MENISQMATESQEPDMSIFDIPEEEVQNQNADGTNQSSTDLDIDPKFMDLDVHEAKYRTAQSRYDKLQKEHELLQNSFAKALKAQSFVEEVVENPDLLEAFIAEVNPDLIKKKDLKAVMQETLAKEFPQFVQEKPSRDEAEKDPGSDGWLYYRRVDDLYQELRSGGLHSDKIKTVKELKVEAEQKRAESKAKADADLLEVRNKLKWSEDTVQNFVSWAQKLPLIELAKIYKFATRMQQAQNPSVQSIQGTSGSSLAEKFLNTI